MSSTLGASVFMGKNYSEILLSIKNTGENLTLKKMSEISEELMLEQSDEIFGVSQSAGKVLHLNSHLWSRMKKSSVFSDSVLCLGKMNQNPISNTVGNDSWNGSKIHHNT